VRDSDCDIPQFQFIIDDDDDFCWCVIHVQSQSHLKFILLMQVLAPQMSFSALPVTVSPPLGNVTTMQVNIILFFCQGNPGKL